MIAKTVKLYPNVPFMRFCCDAVQLCEGFLALDITLYLRATVTAVDALGHLEDKLSSNNPGGQVSLIISNKHPRSTWFTLVTIRPQGPLTHVGYARATNSFLELIRCATAIASYAPPVLKRYLSRIVKQRRWKSDLPEHGHKSVKYI